MARLLLVDDDIAEISAVKRALARAALAPVLATNASDALASIAQRRPDLLLIGATCENGGALALARRLELDAATRGIPLIVLGTAEELPPGAVQLPRPVDPAALSEQVKALLGEPRPVPPPPPPARPAPRKPAVALGRLATPALDLEPKAPPAPPVPSAAPAAAGATEPPAPPAGPAAARPAFERRGPPIVLPQPLERRAQPSDPANARRAAADALRARAEELRRAPEPPASPAAAEAAAGLDALFELAPPAGVSLDQLALTPAPASLPAYAPKTTLPGYGPPPSPAFDPFAEPEPEPARPAEPAPPSAPEPEPATAEAPAPVAEARPPFDGSAFQSEDGAFLAETPFDLPPESTVDLEEVAIPAPPPGAEAALPAPAPEPWPPPPVARPRSLLEEAEERAAAEASLRAEAEAARARVAEQRAQAEAEARAAAAARAEVEATRAREAEERARTEASARADAARRAEEAAGRAREAEAAAREEAEARRLLEQELARLRQQLEVDRRSHETELRSAVERTAAEHAAEATRRGREREAAQAAELKSAAEAAGRAAQAAAEAEVARRAELAARAVAEAEAAGRRAEAEARARADAEAAHQAALAARQAAEAQAEAEAARRAELEAALARATEETGRLAAERDALVKAAAEPPPLPWLADAPPTSDAQEAQESARRRALSLRSRREPEPAGAAWPPAPEPLPALREPEPEPVEPPPATPPAELRSGSLEELPAPRLLALAARARLGGRLDVTGDAERSLWFDDGRVVGAASSASGERVEEVALRLGLLTREQHRQVAGPAAALPARRAALLLVDRGYVKPAELTALVRRRTDEVVFGVFAESGARFIWAPERVPADERIAPDRPTLALAVEGVRRRWLAPRAEAVLGGPASLLTPVQGGPTPADLGLGAEERRALALADGLRTLDEVLALSPLDPLSTRQVLAAAILAGALTVRVVQAGRPSAQVSAAIDLARVKEKLEQVRRADYFTILGLGRVCTPHEVREASERLLAEFDPRRHAGGGEAGLPARLAEIRQVVADARDVLADDALRAEYVRGLGE